MSKTVSDYTALLSGASWWGDKTVGKPVFVTYSFETEAYDYLSELGFPAEFKDSFARLDPLEETAAFFALGHWEGASGIKFLEVPAGQGDIRFGRYDLSKNPNTSDAAAFAYEPLTAIDRSGSYGLAPGGDVFLDLSLTYGSFYDEIHILTHEIGHAIGLKHPFEGDVLLDPTLDTVAHTVMSYGGIPSTIPKLGDLDEAAIAYLYGAEKAAGTQVASWNWDKETYTLTQAGGARADTIRGVSTADVIRAGAGDDLVFSGTGDDRVEAGANDDVVFADAGDDTVYGEAGDDILHAGLGKDALFGGAGNDGLGGDEGNDALQGEDGDDYLDGGDGDDLLAGGAGNDVLAGGAGNDRLDGGDGAQRLGDTADYGEARQQVRVDLNGMRTTVGGKTVIYHAAGTGIGRDTFAGIENVIGGAGSDVLNGDGFANSLWGGRGNDLLRGHGGADILDGGDGGDQLEGGAGNDTLFGGAGNDRLGGGAGADVLRGEAGDDALDGGTENDMLAGGLGNDRLVGGAGDDTLYGGAGNDALDGGSGAERAGDTAHYGDARQLLRVDLNGMSATVDGKTVIYHALGGDIGRDVLKNVENVVGGSGSDVLKGDAAANRLSGGAGNDLIKGNDGADILDGGDGVDRLEGGAGNDTLQGNAGDDVLLGEAGGDRLVGGAGNDTLKGGAGVDILAGGSGADRFVFDTKLGADNLDRLTDFRAGADTLCLDDDVFTALKAGRLADGQFYAGKSAHDVDDRLIFDAKTRSLFYDADGTGAQAQVKVAVFDTATALHASDFLIVV